MKIQDILPSKKENITTINPTVKKESKIPVVQKEIQIVKVSTTPSFDSTILQKRKRSFSFRSPLFLYILSGVALLSLVYGLLVYFREARVYITPKIQAFTLDKESFTAESVSTAPLNFEIMIVEGEEKQATTFTEASSKDSKATGEVTIYNEFSTKSQNLTINTRLDDGKGHIYMTDEAVTIPGYTLKGKVIIPGSVSIGVTASTSGEASNGEPRDFTILGFKGTPKYSKVYARSKTPLSGGTNGILYSLTAEEKGKVTAEITKNLRAKLNKKLEAQVPPGYITYTGSMQFKLNTTDSTFNSNTKDGVVTQSGSLATILFKERELEESVIKNIYNSVAKDELKQITVPELKKLVFSLSEGVIVEKGMTKVSFNLSGAGTLAWHPNTSILPSMLIDAPKDSLDIIFKKDPGIANARVVFRPPWQKQMPHNPAKIKIIGE